MKEFTKLMKALSDPNRVRIIKLLEQRSMCVCELQAALDIAQPTVSKHLKVLEEAGLVDFRKEGLWVNYFLSGDGGNPFAATMLASLRGWLNEEPGVADMVGKIPFLDREALCRK